MIKPSLTTSARGSAALLLAALALSACGGNGGGDGAPPTSIAIDGSSTVFPITQAVAEEYTAETGGEARVVVGVSGTGGGFKRFCAGDIPIANASRKIKESEVEACRQAGVDFMEIPVAYDGISVVVNPDNEFVECMTVDELRQVWQPGSTVQQWSDIRPAWPNETIRLYGPGTDSGTFDYFTEAIMGEEDASRADYTASEDDNVLVQGVAGDPYALGYFGYAYYEENQERLKIVGIDSGSGCVVPTAETIASGEYDPLSRQVFVYVDRAALERPGVREFLEFYMQIAPEVVPQVGYIPLQPEMYQENLAQIGAAAGGGAQPAAES